MTKVINIGQLSYPLSLMLQSFHLLMYNQVVFHPKYFVRRFAHVATTKKKLFAFNVISVNDMKSMASLSYIGG